MVFIYDRYHYRIHVMDIYVTPLNQNKDEERRIKTSHRQRCER